MFLMKARVNLEVADIFLTEKSIVDTTFLKVAIKHKTLIQKQKQQYNDICLCLL